MRSTPGQGSVFFAVLPRVAQQDAEPGPRPTPPAATKRAGAPLVLAVEDDPKDSAWIVETLGRAGYAVETATTGAEALARCHAKRFDAITLDLLLPDMNGRDVLEAIRAAGPNRDAPVIVVTVIAEKGVVAGFHVHDILVKPAQGAALLASLRRAAVEPDGRRPVLVVDDDPKELKLADVALREMGYRATCVADGAAALEAAAHEPPAAVVLDLLMPGMDGFEFLARYRRTPAGRRTPVIVWTVKDVSREERLRLEASVQAVVLKTQGTLALVEELRALVPPPNAGRVEESRR